MGNAIHVFRPATVPDEYGDPQPTLPIAEWPLWKTFNADAGREAFFAPSNPSEQLQPGKNTVISGGIVYIRAAAPTGILATDAISIDALDGKRFAVDGDVGSWSGYAGYRGDQFAVKGVR